MNVLLASFAWNLFDELQNLSPDILMDYSQLTHFPFDHEGISCWTICKLDKD